MALALIYSRALVGVVAPQVHVEVHLSGGLPSFTLVGLPDTEVKESRERVRAAIQNTGFDFPARRITVNLTPADLPKHSARFDLPIAIGILVASGQISADEVGQYELVGELALDGKIRGIRGSLIMSFSTAKAGRKLILPQDNLEEAIVDEKAILLPAYTLSEVCRHLANAEELQVCPTSLKQGSKKRVRVPAYDLKDVKGQFLAKRALEVAAAGGHSLLMSGAPGVGKSMLASRLPSILPPMTQDEALDSAMVLSANHQFDADS